MTVVKEVDIIQEFLSDICKSSSNDHLTCVSGNKY
jgi:hypothetical protein